MAAAAAAAAPPQWTVLTKLISGGAILKEGEESPEGIMMHLVRWQHYSDEVGGTDYMVGPLPGGAIADRVALGRRMFLASFESASFKIVITSVAANNSAPACIAYMRNNMLDGRDVQEVLSSLLDNLTIDIATQPLATFLGDFLLLVTEIQPAMQERTKCMKYAAKFPPELISVGTVCDAQPGFADFRVYALAYNSRANVYIQRLQLSQRNRPASLPGMLTEVDRQYSFSTGPLHLVRVSSHLPLAPLPIPIRRISSMRARRAVSPRAQWQHQQRTR